MTPVSQGSPWGEHWDRWLQTQSGVCVSHVHVQLGRLPDRGRQDSGQALLRRISFVPPDSEHVSVGFALCKQNPLSFLPEHADLALPK